MPQIITRNTETCRLGLAEINRHTLGRVREINSVDMVNGSGLGVTASREMSFNVQDIAPQTAASSTIKQSTQVHLPHVPREVGHPIKVTIDGFDFIHHMTQSDLDAGTETQQVASVLNALKGLIDASSDVLVTTFIPVSSEDTLELTAEVFDTSFTVSLTTPSGVDVILTGEDNTPFTASVQVNSVEIDSHTIAPVVSADATTSQVAGF